MKKLLLLSAILIIFSGVNYAQDAAEKEQFTIVKELPHTDVVDQGSTGTCWSFATTSFLESEILRKGFPETRLSMMYFVYYAYLNKASDYLLFQGNNNFGQGGQAHDVMNVVREHGVSTYEAFPGNMVDDEYKHRELVAQLQQEVKELNKKRENFDASDLSSLEPILKKQLGKLPKQIKYEDSKYTPLELCDKLGINPDDYVELTSFSHHAYYQPFVLEVPDNWSHDLYYNLPIDELMEVMYYSLNQGYTVCWDGDTSEKTFRHKNGKADLPQKQIGKVDQEMRQETFYRRTTTDDHLMHFVGLSKEAGGRDCFYTKNSWGADSNDYEGYLHLTDDYVRLKTIAILVHKDAIPDAIKTKLGL
ncbi:C1 family peptidase [Maribellus sediminis]|uniref:C1 family peptidase n=1 Tax=Maribellus sediminis TaxID=2696285 RepID=UPI0014310394|nr:C1 family peptidase [Maribellus sediminis]